MAGEKSSDSLPAGWISKYKVHRDGSRFKYYKNVRTGRIIYRKKELLDFVESERMRIPFPIMGEKSSGQCSQDLPESSNRRVSEEKASATDSDDELEVRRVREGTICYTRRSKSPNPSPNPLHCFSWIEGVVTFQALVQEAVNLRKANEANQVVDGEPGEPQAMSVDGRGSSKE
ncbi:uncharacterized protein LOC131166158 [Malania oleifera]|uniref:uncharacterized protein LOC131166158 n=1 Tax=Malania oleifera TaxID=397392 RepID=UPI0025AE9081|nr:uncharacterized protein LOC131166158 [Malania oleifera]